jgi:parvulin-like peptidyl-prolyl isomerase
MFFLILFLAFSISSKEKPVDKEAPVAIVANKEVFEKDIPKNVTLEQHLRNLVFFEMAKEKGYVDSVKIKEDKTFEGEMTNRFLRKKVMPTSKPTLHESVSFYENSKKIAKIQLIQTEKFTEALKAYLEVLKGSDFGTISEKYSTNPAIKEIKGLLPQPIRWSYTMPLGLKRVFEMKKDEISFPVKYGPTWNIIKIIEVEGVNPEKNIKMQDIIERTSFKTQFSRAKASSNMGNLYRLVTWVANPKTDPEGTSLLAKRLTMSEEKSSRGEKVFEDQDMDVVLARSTLGEYKIRDFVTDASGMSSLSVFAGNDETVAGFINDQILNRFLIIMSKRTGIQREPSFIEAYNTNIRNSALDFFKRKEILNIIVENEDDLKNFYDNNKGKYKVEERRKVSLIEVKEEREAQEIRKKLLKGEKFEVLASEKSIGTGKKKGGEIGYIGKDQRSAIGQEAFLLKKGVISKPFKTEKGWAIIKVTDIKKSYVPDYSEVKGSVRYDYKMNKAKEIEDKIFEQNKDKYGLKVLS